MAAIKRPSHRPASPLYVRVSMLLSDARTVALSGRQFQSFQRKLSSRAQSAARSALLSSLDPGSHQGIFLFTKFTSLNSRNGIRRLMVNLTVPESLQQRSDPCVLGEMFCWAAKVPSQRHTNPQPAEPCKREYQCQTSLYLYIECISPHLSLPASWGIRAARVCFTHIACRIPAMIAFRARP